jgi:hypothetical protein
MPPQAAADVAVAQLQLAAALAVELAEVEPAAAALELLEELELLLHPAASNTEPTAATVATIAFDARKIRPSHAAPRDNWRACVGILARQVVILAKRVERKVTVW